MSMPRVGPGPCPRSGHGRPAPWPASLNTAQKCNFLKQPGAKMTIFDQNCSKMYLLKQPGEAMSIFGSGVWSDKVRQGRTSVRQGLTSVAQVRPCPRSAHGWPTWVRLGPWPGSELDRRARPTWGFRTAVFLQSQGRKWLCRRMAFQENGFAGKWLCRSS